VEFKKHSPNIKGFSLIEILIAILLLAFLMTGVFTVVDNSTNSYERVSKEDDHFIALQIGLQRLERDLTSLYSPFFFERLFDYSRDMDTVAQNIDEGANNSGDGLLWRPTARIPQRTKSLIPVPMIEYLDQSLTFFTFSNQRRYKNQKESLYAWVRYEWRRQTPSFFQKESGVEVPSDRIELVRLSEGSDIHRPDFDWENLTPFVVMRDLKSIKFFFWSPTKKDYVGSIREMPNNEQYAIRAIKVELEWFNEIGEVEKIINIYRSPWPFFDIAKEDKELKALEAQIRERKRKNALQDAGGGANPNDPPGGFGNDGSFPQNPGEVPFEGSTGEDE
jgi:prepilin-type N-terminal cleavage/methylation domain-containing protein